MSKSIVVRTSIGAITFTQKGQTTAISAPGRRTFKLKPCRKSPGWFTAEWDGAGMFDLQPFVLEETAQGAYMKALCEFWELADAPVAPVMSSPVIKGKRIVFADHDVVCRAGKTWSKDFVAEYLKEMADSLEPSGTAAQHRRELRNMNNDGTWAVVAH